MNKKQKTHERRKMIKNLASAAVGVALGEDMEPITEASPRLEARIAGGSWLMVSVAGTLAFIIGSTLIMQAMRQQSQLQVIGDDVSQFCTAKPSSSPWYFLDCRAS